MERHLKMLLYVTILQWITVFTDIYGVKYYTLLQGE